MEGLAMHKQFSTPIEARRSALFNLMGEVSCLSAQAALCVVGQFPEYRVAKDDPNHDFWGQTASKMIGALERQEAELVNQVVFN
jgi:predicted phosphohydrolase